MNEKKSFLIGCAIGAVVLLSIGCFAVFGTGIYFFNEIASSSEYEDELSDGTATPTPEMRRIEEDPEQDNSQDTHGNDEQDTSPSETPEYPDDTLWVLNNSPIPENDPRDLAMLFLGLSDVPELVPDLNAPYDIGDMQDFWIIDTAENINSQVQAVLRYETPHMYFWIQDGVRYKEDELKAIAETFEQDIYPTTRAFFGSEWSPGIDGDPHIYVLYTRGIGFGTAGYFSPGDLVHPLAHEYSNAHEMFYFNADNSPLGSEYTQGVLAHEFQHMIHWSADRNETTWINEGFAEVAMLLNGYDPGGFDRVYLQNTDWQLNDWDPGGDNYADYGASFLFFTYFLDRFGEDISQALVAEQRNSFASIDHVLAGARISQTADDVVLDWAITNFVLDDGIGDGRYDYVMYRNPAKARLTEEVSSCTGTDEIRGVSQYGVDYIQFTCEGAYTLQFEGSQIVDLVPTDAYSGDFFFWSNKSDESDMTLTRYFDFSDHEGELTLSYHTWYDIEIDWDYVYLLASTDGENWEVLITPSGTAYDPTGNSYGWGYTGFTEGWIEEVVDISQFAGGEVYLRFEYVTDANIHGEGLMLDDITIQEVGYFEDFEEGTGDWDGQGFVRVMNELPQTFMLALIVAGNSGTEVQFIEVDANNLAEIDFEIGNDVTNVTLVVLGTTRFTRQPGAYTFRVIPK